MQKHTTESATGALSELPIRYMGRRSTGRMSKAKRYRLDTVLNSLLLPEGNFATADDLTNQLQINKETEIWLEIGYGYAENLINTAKNAQNNKIDRNIIGCEVFLNGVDNAIRGILKNKLKNITLANEEAEKLLARLPESSISKIIALFPDPWSKKKHRKRRLYSEDRLSLINRCLRKNGTFTIASDDSNYIEDLLEEISKNCSNWKVIIDDSDPVSNGLFITRYCQKAIESNRSIRLVECRKI